MKEIKRFQIRGVTGDIKRVDFDGRTVDYWLPKAPVSHLIIAHDGQNVNERSWAKYLDQPLRFWLDSTTQMH